MSFCIEDDKTIFKRQLNYNFLVIIYFLRTCLGEVEGVFPTALENVETSRVVLEVEGGIISGVFLLSFFFF